MLSFDLAAAAGGSKLIATYTVSGYQPDKGFAALAAPVDAVMREQVDSARTLRGDRKGFSANPARRKRRRGM